MNIRREIEIDNEKDCVALFWAELSIVKRMQEVDDYTKQSYLESYRQLKDLRKRIFREVDSSVLPCILRKKLAESIADSNYLIIESFRGPYKKKGDNEDAIHEETTEIA